MNSGISRNISFFLLLLLYGDKYQEYYHCVSGFSHSRVSLHVSDTKRQLHRTERGVSISFQRTHSITTSFLSFSHSSDDEAKDDIGIDNYSANDNETQLDNNKGFFRSTRKLLDVTTKIVTKPFQKSSPNPSAIAAVLRDAAQASVETTVKEIIVPAVMELQEQQRQEKGDEIGTINNIDFDMVEKAADDAVSRAVASSRSISASTSANAVTVQRLAEEAITSSIRANDLAEEALVRVLSAAEIMEEAILAAKDASAAAQRARTASENFRAEANDAVLASENAARESAASTARIMLQDSLKDIMVSDTAKNIVINDQIEGDANDNSNIDVMKKSKKNSVVSTGDVLSKEDLKRMKYDDVGYELKKDNMSPPFIGDDQCLIPGEAVVRVEKAPENSRRIFAGIDIYSSVDDVWKVLTDYDRLQDVVPNLVDNTVMELYESTDRTVENEESFDEMTDEEKCRLLSLQMGGAKMKQIGGAKVVGINFSASMTLEVREWPEGLPDYAHFQDETYNGQTRNTRAREDKKMPLVRYRFPRPFAINQLPEKVITMQCVENDDGEFRCYQGVWRMQPLPGCSEEGRESMRLTYAVEISPRPYLPVALIEGRIAKDLCNNLKAIRDYVSSGK